MVKAHLLALLEPELTEDVLLVLRGIGPFLTKSDLGAYLGPFARAIVGASDRSERDRFTRILAEEFRRMQPELKEQVLDWLTERSNRLEWSGREGDAAVLINLKKTLDVPF